MQIVDALDSLWLMGLEDEYRQAEAWIIQNLSFEKDVAVSAFETTIRVLGGLLSAYFLSSNPLLLQKSIDLGHRLLRSWQEGPIPHERVNLKTGHVSSSEPQLGSSLAEIGTVQLEMELLSVASGDARFRYRAQHVMNLVGSLLTERGGLLPIMMQPKPPLHWTNYRITLGGRGDSFYEYLLKQWLVTNRTETRYLEMYQTFVDAIRRAFVGQTSPSNFTFIREVDSARELDALVPAENRWHWNSAGVASSHFLPGAFLVLPVFDPDSSEDSDQAASSKLGSPPDETCDKGNGLERNMLDGTSPGDLGTMHESCDAGSAASHGLVESGCDDALPAEPTLTHEFRTKDGATKSAHNSESDGSAGGLSPSPGSSRDGTSGAAVSILNCGSDASPQDELSSALDDISDLGDEAESTFESQLVQIELEIEDQEDETSDSTAGPASPQVQLDIISAIQRQMDQASRIQKQVDEMMQSKLRRSSTQPAVDKPQTTGDGQKSTSHIDGHDVDTAASQAVSHDKPSPSPPSLKQPETVAFVIMPSMVGNQSCAMAELLLSQSWSEFSKRVILQYNGSNQLPHHMRRHTAEMLGKQLEHQCNMIGKLKMDHLSCFLPGLLALGVMTGAANDSMGELELAAGLAETCARMWTDTPTGLAPESVFWNTAPGESKDMHSREGSLYSALRPETVESLWYLYMATGDSKWQDLGWSIFEKIELHARVDSGGYSGIEDVFETGEVKRRDRMETFLLSETFKYLFLLFADWEDQPIDLTKIVMNTEGHLLPVVDSQLQRDLR